MHAYILHSVHKLLSNDFGGDGLVFENGWTSFSKRFLVEMKKDHFATVSNYKVKSLVFIPCFF